MKLAKLSTRALFGGLLGLVLSFLLAQFSSQALYEVYSTSTLFRTITGNSPNSLASGLKQISWALFFCAGWWMFWRFDLFFSPVPQLSDNDKKGTVPQSNVKEKKEETFKPEEEVVNSEKDEKHDNSSSSDESKTDNDEENNDADSISEIEENDEQFFQVLQITEDSPRDFDSIKSIYRKKIAQYHPDKVAAMGPEIQQVAEQKAKEINEAYEHFRKKFSSL